jgi:transcriptional repressor NrdR
MKCPFCGNADSQVKDSRPADDGVSIKRRRYCAECDSRFTTYERVMLRELMVVKTNGERRPLDRDKIHRSITIATRKRPVSAEQAEELVNKIVRKLETLGEAEIASAQIGEAVMEGLQSLDKVAYIRYASVYRNFREAKDFEEFVESLRGKKEK